jgi:hypothetical protein
MATSALNLMDVATFIKIAPRLPPRMAILVRGPTGVGKSHITQAIGKQLNLPVIDVRGSTMDESKVTGIPDFEAGKIFKKAMFLLPSWYVRACQEPVLLFLDEMNRANPQVLQAFFQVVLDRCLGNDANGEPMPLHPETRVFAAVNFGSEYDVAEMDPALLRRFWTVDIEPEVGQWCEWASAAGKSTVLVDFICQNPQHWRVDPGSGKVTPGSVLPTPASWDRFNASVAHMGIDLDEVAGKKDDGTVYAVARGFVGIEAAISFVDFLEKYQNIISAEDLIDGRADEAKLRKLKQSEISQLIDKVVAHCVKNKWTKAQVDRVVWWLKDVLPGEQQMALYNGILNTCNMDNIRPFHAPLGSMIVDIINAAKARSAAKK